MTNNELVDFVHNFAKERKIKIIYATKFGSHLYGTATPESDTDIKGVFIPTKESLLLEQAPKVFTYKTGDDHSKNSSEDIDMEFYSLHNFLKMVERGDTGALDLLFSNSNIAALIFSTYEWDEVLKVREKLFNPTNTRAFIGYAIGQSKKYSLKGNKLKALEKLMSFVGCDELRYEYSKDERLSSYITNILDKCSSGTFIMEDFCTVDGNNPKRIRGIRVLGSVHLETIAMNEFVARLKETHAKFGIRAHAAKDAEGLDFKALSHAFRVARQAEELLFTGEIKFPLAYTDLIMSIKTGSKHPDDIADLLEGQVDKVDFILTQPKLIVKNQFDKRVQEKLILSFYESDSLTNIRLNQYENLRECFDELVKDVLGDNYYNEGADVYSCDKFTCRDLKEKIRK